MSKGSTTLVEHLVDGRDVEQARRALDALRRGAPIAGDTAVPAAATAVIERVLETMAEGRGVMVVALDADLTTQQAADLLEVPHSTLIRFLDAGGLPFQGLGDHRRLVAKDVLAYRDRRRVEQNAALDELVAMNQRAGFYD